MTGATVSVRVRVDDGRGRVRTFVLFLFNMLPDFTTALQLLLVHFCSNATTLNISSFGGWGGLSLRSGGDIVCNGHRCVDCDWSVCGHCVCCCRRYHHPPSA